MVQPVDLQVSLNAAIEQGPRAYQEQAAATYRSLQGQETARQQALNRPEQVTTIPATATTIMHWIDNKSAKKSYRYREIEAEYRTHHRKSKKKKLTYHPHGAGSGQELLTGQLLDLVA